ncbi:MAG: hypothetical protein ACHQ2Z_08190 [Elusimicrobiota bacterium]
MNTKKKIDMWATAAAVLMIAMLLAVAAFAQSASFRFFGPLSRVITPNGDPSKNNGTAIFCFDNPAGSGVTGNIFTLLGSAVASMGPETKNPSGTGCPLGAFDTVNQPGISGGYLTWDGRSNGTVVHSGVYVYRLTADQKSYTGTIIVVR